MAKTYSHKQFTATINNGETIVINCYTTDTRNGFCHHAESFINGNWEHSRISYCNRTWESFEYESMLSKHIDKFPKAMRGELRAILIDKTAKEEHERCEKQLATFTKVFNSLSDKGKEIFKGTEVHTEEEANTLTAMVGLASVMGL